MQSDTHGLAFLGGPDALDEVLQRADYGLVDAVHCFSTALGSLLLGGVATIAGSYQPALLLVVTGPLLATASSGGLCPCL